MFQDKTKDSNLKVFDKDFVEKDFSMKNVGKYEK